MKRLFIFILIGSFLVSCDPALMLVIKVPEKDNVSITVYGNKISLPEEDYNKEKVILKVPFTDSIVKYEKAYFYGIGGWDTVSVLNLTENIDSIIIRTSSSSMVLSNKEELQNFFLNNRSGWAKSVITIEAK